MVSMPRWLYGISSILQTFDDVVSVCGYFLKWSESAAVAVVVVDAAVADNDDVVAVVGRYWSGYC